MCIYWYGFVAFFTAVITICWGYLLLPALRRWCVAGHRPATPQRHQLKQATPSCGGIIFVFVLVPVVTLYHVVVHYIHAGSLLFVVCAYAAIGGYDDLCKVWYGRGVSEVKKFALQIFCGLVWAFSIYTQLPDHITWITPIGDITVATGVWWILWSLFLIAGVSNAYNLTDGIDGLAARVLAIHSCGMLVIIQLLFRPEMAWYALWLSLLAGLACGFLWHNTYPARFFMGDVGSLSIGALLAALALMSHTEWLLPMTLIIPLLETMSVILQKAARKLGCWRPFRCAPLHHHYELIGWSERTIVLRASLLSLAALAVLCALLMYTW